MTQQREQVSGIGLPTLRPSASPVDTFSQPNAGDSLSQLARGLSTIAPSLGRFSDDLAQRDEQQQLDAGREKARSMGLEAKQLAQAVKAGTIPEAANPWFRAGLQEQLGRVAADQFGQQITVAMDNDPSLKDSTNLQDFDQYVSKQRQQFLQDNVGDGASDRFFSNGFGANSDAWIHTARQQFAEGVSQRLSKLNDDALAARTYAGVQQAIDGKVSHEQIGADLTAMLDDQYRLNPGGGQRAQQSVVEGLVRLATAKQDSTVLDILNHVKTGVTDKAGNRLGLNTTGYGAKALDEVTREIGAKKIEDWDMAQKVKKEGAEPIINDFVTQFTKAPDPTSFDTTSWEKQAAAVDPNAVATIQSFKKDWIEERYAGDPRVEADYFTKVFTKPGSVSMNQLADAYTHTKQISRGAFLTMVNEMQQQAAAERSGAARGLLGDPDLEKMQARVRQEFIPEAGESTQEMRDRAELAVDQATVQYVQQKKAGKITTSDQLEGFIHNQVITTSTNLLDPFDQKQLTRLRAQIGDRLKGQGIDPNEPGAGALPDWEKTAVVTKDRASALSAEWDAYDSGKQKLSDATKQLMLINKVPPNKKAMKDFIDAQKRLANR